MNQERIPEQLQRFIAEHIHSVVELECLLLLRDSAQAWTVAELAAELRVGMDWAERETADLIRRGLVVASDSEPPGYTYSPRSADLENAVSDLASAYAGRRVAVIECLYKAPVSPVQSFADAFRLKKGKTDG